MEGEQCFICSKPAALRCGQCGAVYCGQHAKYHLHPDTGRCFPFSVARVAGVGRVLLAAADLAPGDEIFREEEMVVGPSRRVPPVCLGCGCRVTGEVVCAGCGWPLCEAGRSCAEAWRHSDQECRALAPSGPATAAAAAAGEEVCGVYRAVMALRVLQLEPAERDYLLEFMDHSEDREPGEADSVVETIRGTWGQRQHGEQLIRRVEGILDVNTVEHRVAQEGAPSGQAFLPITSLASHSCRSNSFKDKVSVPGWVVTRAKRAIRAGEEITFHYCGGLKGRLMRRWVLRQGWYFWCTCERCVTADEAGAELSTLRCDCGGAVRPSDPRDQDTCYSCDTCGRSLDKAHVEATETALKDELELCYTNDTVALENVLNKHKDKFHAQHWLVLIIKWLLVTSWGRVPGLKHHQLEEAVLERKLLYARHYLTALDIVDPGISHNRGTTLWELHAATSFLANKRFQEERLAPVKFVASLASCLETVREAQHSLQFSKEGSNEEGMWRAAAEAEARLMSAINAFQSMLGVKAP